MMEGQLDTLGKTQEKSINFILIHMLQHAARHSQYLMEKL